MFRPCSQRVTVSKQWESQFLGSQAAASVDASVSDQTQPKTNSDWDNPMWALWSWYSHDSDTDASVVILPRWEFLLVQNSHHSVGTRWRQDYTQHVMLNNCYWPLDSEVLIPGSHTTWRGSPFGYKPHLWVSKALDTDRQHFFSLPYFCFHTSDSALHHFPLTHATKIIPQGQIKTIRTSL